MIIESTQKKYRKLSKTQKKLAFTTIDFYVDKIMPRMAKSLSVKILGDNLLESREGIHGDCDYIDCENRYPREFHIRVYTGLSRRDFIATIIHEMTHVKQYARGELRDLTTKINLCYWKGKRIDRMKVDYDKHPWEIEACKYQYLYADEIIKNIS